MCLFCFCLSIRLGIDTLYFHLLSLLPNRIAGVYYRLNNLLNKRWNKKMKKEIMSDFLSRLHGKFYLIFCIPSSKHRD